MVESNGNIPRCGERAQFEYQWPGVEHGHPICLGHAIWMLMIIANLQNTKGFRLDVLEPASVCAQKAKAII